MKGNFHHGGADGRKRLTTKDTKEHEGGIVKEGFASEFCAAACMTIRKKRARVSTGPAGYCFGLVLQTVNIELALGRSCAYGIMRRGDEHLAVGHNGLGELDAEAGNVGGIL